MGIKSKPKMPAPDPMELELATIGRDVAKDYETNYRGMNEALLGRASVDRSDQSAGRATVDGQMALSNQLAGSILRGQSTGGFGGAGSISLVDAGATGAAVQSAGAAGYGAGRENYVTRLGGAVDAVQAGQDTAAQGLRTVAGISSRDALEEYNNTQAMNSIRAQGLAQIVGAVGQGAMARRSLAAQTPKANIGTPTAQPNMAASQNFSMPFSQGGGSPNYSPMAPSVNYQIGSPGANGMYLYQNPVGQVYKRGLS